MDDPASFFLFFAAEAGTSEPTSIAAYTIINVALIVLLVFINGFFVAAEFAIFAVRKSRN